jgi:dTMP kinase
MTSRGRFLTFEGVEGGGKSTQMRLLCERLRSLGHPVTENIEPGGTPIGRQIRAILLEAANHELCPSAELLLFFASRAQAVEQLIRPALESGHIVVSDRFTDSSFAYQGIARGLGESAIAMLETIACRGLRPDLTICLDLDVEQGLARARARNRETNGGETRLDDESIAFHRKVREAYHLLAAREPARVKLIDAERPAGAVATAIWDVVAPVLPEKL